MLLWHKGLSSQGYGFSSSHIWIWVLHCEESWGLKCWCFWTVVLEKTLESPLDCKEIQPVHRKGDQSWVFIGRTDVEAETPTLGHLIWRVNSLEKTLMLEKNWRQEQKGMREWDDWMPWVWANSGRWWRTGKPGMLQSMGSQRVGHDWATEQWQQVPNILILQKRCTLWPHSQLTPACASHQTDH